MVGDAHVADMRASADLWTADVTPTVMAIRGERLVLAHLRFPGRDQGREAFVTDVLGIVEINADERIVAFVSFDLDDFDAALEELDARFLAGEGAAHANTWSVIAGARAALFRHELPPTTPDWVNLDHRRGIAFAPGDLTAYIRATWNHEQDASSYIEAVHQLNDLGAVFVQVVKGTSQDGFDAEWRVAELMTVEGGLINRAEFFDEADLDAALGKFEQLSRPAPQLENAASQAYMRFQACFAARDWIAMDEALADDAFHDDRRRMVGAGLREGHNAVKAEMSALAEIGVKRITSDTIATRGRRLILTRSRASGRDQRPDAFRTDVLNIAEINAEDEIAALITFDSNDFDAAIAELDARYLAGEAADHAHTWSVIAGSYASISRDELPQTTPDCVSVDHRRVAAFAPGDLIAYVRAGLDLNQHVSTYIETVHRLNDLGAVVTHVAHGASREGFEGDWRAVDISTVDGDAINRWELFEEADLDAALAKFEQLSRPAPLLTNTASQVGERYREHFAAGDWDAMAATIADDFFGDDRRRVVGSGVRIGREAQLADMRAIADLFIANMTWTDIATRGDRLVLFRVGFLDRDQKPDAFRTEVLCVAEIDADERIVASVSFDLDDVDAAFEELDARYLAGEAATHARTWSVITGTYAAVNRREAVPTTPDWVFVDHLPLQRIEAGDVAATVRATWDLTPDISFHIEAVHRLTNVGAVVTRIARGTSKEGFDAEWRQVDILTVEGDKVNRCELFDEADLDAALARFEELQPPARWLENAASRVCERCLAHLAAHDWAAMADTLAADLTVDDRRRVVNGGIHHGREAAMQDFRVAADLGFTTSKSVVLATRGVRVALTRVRYSGHDQQPDAFQVEILHVVEIDADEKMASVGVFDFDDIDAAFEELDARYVAGEAAAYSRTWSLVAAAYACYNRRELPATTPDWVNVDRRRMTMYAPGDVFEYVRGGWNYISDISFRIEAVHQLSNLGAVVTQAGRGTSQEGFEAEWREIHLMTVEGDLFNRSEMFDEADIDAALARFEELHPQPRQLENAASQVAERFRACFAARDWNAMAEMLADNLFTDDRRRVVGAGVRHGRDAHIADLRGIANLWNTNLTTTYLATRGGRLVLARLGVSDRDQMPGAFRTEVLSLSEINADERIVAFVTFDLDDIDAAFEELDARYLAGEAATHAHAWSVIALAYTAMNRHELPATTPDWENIDHRRGIAVRAR